MSSEIPVKKRSGAGRWVVGCLGVLVVLLVAGGSGGYLLVYQPLVRAQQARNNMARIMLAVHEFHSQNNELPSGLILPRGSAIGPNTKIQSFSWRVQILPMLGEEERKLYEKFDFNQPWDSEHNMQVSQEMPDVFRSPYDQWTTSQAGYLAIAGKDGAFPAGGQEGRRSFADTTDGTGNTVAVVEVQNSSVIWTAPQDLTVEEFATLMEQGSLASGAEIQSAAWVGLLDSSVRRLPKGLPAATAKALGTRAGGDKAELPGN